ncbi:MAG: Lrp/AsnC family transcriptional regulator [Clostridiales bacterium]|nr:Lrp/AsnC family transcriptional regulator [Clostridiales bacterium]
MENLKKGIIKLLCEDARYTNSQIASVLGVEKECVEKAICELESDGVIVKYAAIINNEKFASGKVQAFIEVKVAPQKLKGFDSYAEELYSFNEVQSLYLMSGGFDLAVFVEGDNLGEVAKFIAEKLSVIDGIVGVQTHFILKKYKIEGQVTSVKEESKRQIIQA